MQLFHTLSAIGNRQNKIGIFSFTILFPRFGGPLVCFQYICATIGTLWHVFHETNTKKEAALKEALNMKIEVMHLKIKLRQAQM
jgi:hypothetical protein